MPGLLIKDLPDALHHQLQLRAAAHHRSLAREALTILQSALDDRAGPPTLAEIDQLRMSGRAPLTDEILEEALREGRR